MERTANERACYSSACCSVGGIALDPEDLGVPVGFSAMSSIGTGVSSLSLGVIVYIRISVGRERGRTARGAPARGALVLPGGRWAASSCAVDLGSFRR